mgnify:CR=1 FL=1
MNEELNSSNSFAKKYRPKLLKDLIGQDLAKQQIAGILKSGRIPCAMLLTGDTGCGKTTIARVIARHINRVKECTPLNDIFEFNIGTNGTMDDIRNLVESTKYLPKNKKHKSIYILDEVHKLTKNSASALLKEIEEPPAHVIFLLCTNEPDKLLTTLVNRCEKINLKSYSEEDILKLLRHVCEQEEIDLKEQDLAKIAMMGNYQPRECLVSLQGIANILAGGKELTPEAFQEEIKKAVKNSIFEYCNSFILSLYLKNYSAAIKRIDECGDPQALATISLNNSRSLVKYIASLGSSKYDPKIPYPILHLKDMIKEKLKDLSLEEITIRSNEVHQLLADVILENRTTNMDIQDSLFSKIGKFCFK